MRERIKWIGMAALLIALPCLALFVVVFFADTGGWSWECPVLKYTGILCPGCGATRGVIALLRGDIAAAAMYNPLVLLIPPYFVCALAFLSAEAACISRKGRLITLTGYPRVRRARDVLCAAIIAGITIFTLARNLIA